jgi:nucleoid-associated protein YgaU
MRRGTRIALASGVILTGIACAYLLRKPPAEISRPGAADDNEAPLRPSTRRAPLPDSVPRLLGEIDPLEPSDDAQSPTYRPANDPGEASIANQPFPDARDDQSAPIRIVKHRIGDGDTLTSLARRYLGDGSRYQEIFAANRDRLASADVLPIGIEIEIRIGAPPAPPADPADEFPLVPVPRRTN